VLARALDDIDDSPDVTRIAMMLPLHATRK
jgi:hypothetical protein